MKTNIKSSLSKVGLLSKIFITIQQKNVNRQSYKLK